jgi:tetratricopeptide (TPR) repeat protein
MAPLDRDLAARYLDDFNLIRQQWPFPAVAATEVGNWSGVVGLLAVNPGSVAVPATLLLRSSPNRLAFSNQRALEFFLRNKPYGPAALPVLAVRAARRAIAASPDYPECYFALAEAYALLWRDQEEHWVGLTSAAPDLPRRKLRDTQLLTALEYYLLLRPEDGDAHLKLFQNYARLEFWDLAVDHLRAATEATASRGRARRESPEDFKRRLDQMEQELGKLKAEVKNREDDYQVDSRDKPLQGKVQKAIQNHLIKRARDLLLEADPAQLGPREIDLLINLLLSTGRPDQARAVLSEGWKTHLGINYDWYNTLIAAASGNYREARQYLEEYILRFEQSTLEGALRLLEMQTFQGGLSSGSLYGVSTIPNRTRELADLRVLRGLLALEEGENTVAANSFQAALDMGERQNFHFESRPIAVRYVQFLKGAGP